MSNWCNFSWAGVLCFFYGSVVFSWGWRKDQINVLISSSSCNMHFFYGLEFSEQWCIYSWKNTSAVVKVMPPILSILLGCPMTSEVDVGSMAIEIETSHQNYISFCCHVTDGSRRAVWQNGTWCGSKYQAKGLERIPPCGKYGTHWHFHSADGDQTVDVSTVKQWVMSFSSDYRDMKDKPHYKQPYTAHHIMKQRASPSAHLCESVDYNKGTVYRAENWLQCIGNNRWQHRNITKFVPGKSQEYSHRLRKNTICIFIRTYRSNTKLKVTVSWITSLPVVTTHLVTMRQSQNISPRSGNKYPIKEKVQYTALSR